VCAVAGHHQVLCFARAAIVCVCVFVCVCVCMCVCVCHASTHNNGTCHTQAGKRAHTHAHTHTHTHTNTHTPERDSGSSGAAEITPFRASASHTCTMSNLDPKNPWLWSERASERESEKSIGKGGRRATGQVRQDKCDKMRSGRVCSLCQTSTPARLSRPRAQGRLLASACHAHLNTTDGAPRVASAGGASRHTLAPRRMRMETRAGSGS